MKNFKPMLAGKAPANLADLTFPVLASPKLDGIRCVIRDGGEAKSRSLKPIPNAEIRAALQGLPDGLDGELMVDGGDFNECQSFIMSKSKTGEAFAYHVFDWDLGEGDWTFEDRFDRLSSKDVAGHPRVRVVPHIRVETLEELVAFEVKCLAEGFEGVMVRSLSGPYKYGRSTTREGSLLKVKRFADEEAVIVSVEERMHNKNEKVTDALGHGKRSTHKAGKVPAGDMGALVCKTEDGIEFGLGTGYTAAMRADLWERREELVGLQIKFKYQPEPGGRFAREGPRFPVFLGFRHEDDQ